MLSQVRSFFAQRDVLEVDTPCLVPQAPLDANVDVIAVVPYGFLHTSPEYGMKKLLAQGSKDIYFLGHVFRKEELGRLHNIEFTMIEWYRLGISFEAMMDETRELLSLFIPSQHLTILPYRQAFLRYVGLDPFTTSLEELRALLPSPQWDRPTALAYLMSEQIEPHLGQSEMTAIVDYPHTQAALAQTNIQDGYSVARRFEIYFQGVELCNGYEELTDQDELRSRFEEENRERILQGKEPYELDETLIESVAHVPPCCGVSIGFDRAFYLQERAHSIHDIQLLSKTKSRMV
jgi:lysyl-tRNA synthetase class 2